MYPAATLFFDVCVQNELWPGGSWPLVSHDQRRSIERMFALGGSLSIRQGGIVCRHGPGGPPPLPDTPPHCRDESTWSARPLLCAPVLPAWIETSDEAAEEPPLDRSVALYLDSGCALRPDAGGAYGRFFAHMTAGIRDAVVFGAGLEHGMARVIEALLARRIRTHVVLDASGAADEVAAQLVVAVWKRQGVDVTTEAMIERLLRN